jgi:hypothetical protein
MKKIKMKPKKVNRTNVNNKFTLIPSAQGEISRSVLYDIKLKKLIRFLTDYKEKSGIDYQRLCSLCDAIEKIINKNNEIKKQNQQQKYTVIGGYNGQNK